MMCWLNDSARCCLVCFSGAILMIIDLIGGDLYLYFAGIFLYIVDIFGLGSGYHKRSEL
jgi:hypothetical protein